MYFGYDIDVELENIQSPLPPRKIETNLPAEEVEKPEEKQPIVTTTEVNGGALPVAEKKKINWNWKLILIIGGVLLLGLILVLILTANGRKKNTVVTLNYWGLWEDESVMNGVISDFESKNPGIKINYKRNQISDYRTRLAGRLAKTGSDGIESVDIFRIHNTWIPMFRDYLEPVPTESVNKIGLESDFFEVYKKDLKEGGKWMSVPLMYDGLALFYNKDLLAAAKMEVPNNWWELRSAAQKLTQKDGIGKITVAGAALGLANNNVDNWSDIVGLMLAQNGANMTIDSENNNAKIIDVLKFYASFAQGGEKVWDESLANSTLLFASGKLAFYFGPSWKVFDIEKVNKSLNYGVAAVPQLPTTGGTEKTGDDTQLTNIHWGSYWTEGINNRSKYKNQAWKFLEYLSSNEALEKMYAAESQIRSFGEIYPRKSMATKISSNQKLAPWVATADNATSWYLAAETGDAGVNMEMQKYFADAINSLNGDKDSQEVMTTLKSGLKQIIQKYSLKK